jgi:hypothetical protein
MYTMFKALVNKRSFDDQELSDVLHAFIETFENSSDNAGKCVAFSENYASPIGKKEWDLIKKFLIDNSINASVFHIGSLRRTPHLNSNTALPDNPWGMCFDLSKTDLINKIKSVLNDNDCMFRMRLDSTEVDWSSPTGHYYA